METFPGTRPTGSASCRDRAVYGELALNPQSMLGTEMLAKRLLADVVR